MVIRYQGSAKVKRTSRILSISPSCSSVYVQGLTAVSAAGRAWTKCVFTIAIVVVEKKS